MDKITLLDMKALAERDVPIREFITVLATQDIEIFACQVANYSMSMACLVNNGDVYYTDCSVDNKFFKSFVSFVIDQLRRLFGE